MRIYAEVWEFRYNVRNYESFELWENVNIAGRTPGFSTADMLNASNAILMELPASGT